jgi:hypothetical protein
LAYSYVNQPATTFNKSNVPYRLVNGAKVASDWQDLTDGELETPISIDENGSSRSSKVWTNVSTDGSKLQPQGSNSCGCFNSYGQYGGYSSNAGRSYEKDSQWTKSSYYNCETNRFRLYCFQQ